MDTIEKRKLEAQIWALKFDIQCLRCGGDRYKKDIKTLSNEVDKLEAQLKEG